MGRRKVKLLKRENDEGSVTTKQRVVGEVKRQRGKRKVGGSVIVGVYVRDRAPGLFFIGCWAKPT